MSSALLALSVFMVALALWLGLYLLNRDPRSPRLRLAALGLISYAAALALTVLDPISSTAGFMDARWLVLFLPALCWTGTLIYLLPDESALRSQLIRGYYVGQVPGTLLVGIAALWLSGERAEFLSTVLYLAFAAVVLLPLLLAGWLVWQHRRALRPGGALGLVLVPTLFFGLSVSLLLFPLGVLPLVWLLPLMGIDLLILGIVIAALDAFELGETLLPDIIRSLDYTMLTVILFGLPIAAVMALETGNTPTMRALLLAIVTLAVAVQTLGDRVETWLDRLILARFPGLRAARAELRAVQQAIPRLNPSVDFDAMDDADFTRLTRRALSHLRDLPHLASSPLTYLPLVETRLAMRGEEVNTLSRANELKRVLMESVERLRPPGNNGLRTGDAWRHYNALYIPYVLGLKPLSHQPPDMLEPDVVAVLEWFRTQVPERTLHNWQTAAAKLIARDLREQMAAHSSSVYPRVPNF